jgi:hypothetical protein
MPKRHSLNGCRRWLQAGLCALLCIGGCGPSSKLDKVVVTGTVTLDGQPLPNGEIRFFPIDGTPGSVSGGPIVDGDYRAVSRGGVPVGNHRVEIRGFRTATASRGGPNTSLEGGPAEQYLAAKYNTETELTRQVDAKNKVQDFQLTSN